MARRTSDRWRCLTVGCNPTLKSQRIAEQHRDQTGHRIARWPVRSEEGKRKQHDRAVERVRRIVGDGEYYEAHREFEDHNKGPEDE